MGRTSEWMDRATAGPASPSPEGLVDALVDVRFPLRFRGYDPVAVDALLDALVLRLNDLCLAWGSSAPGALPADAIGGCAAGALLERHLVAGLASSPPAALPVRLPRAVRSNAAPAPVVGPSGSPSPPTAPDPCRWVVPLDPPSPDPSAGEHGANPHRYRPPRLARAAALAAPGRPVVALEGEPAHHPVTGGPAGAVEVARPPSDPSDADDHVAVAPDGHDHAPSLDELLALGDDEFEGLLERAAGGAA